MIKILGAGDIFGAILLLSAGYRLDVPSGLIIGVSAYLFLKAIIFFFDIGSIFDIAVGILLILSLSMTLPLIIFFILAALLGIKGAMSLFA